MLHVKLVDSFPGYPHMQTIYESNMQKTGESYLFHMVSVPLPFVLHKSSEHTREESEYIHVITKKGTSSHALFTPSANVEHFGVQSLPQLNTLFSIMKAIKFMHDMTI